MQSTISATPTFWQIDPKGAWKVRSKSHPEIAHTVRRCGLGFSCTCPAVVRCWHIKTIEQAIGKEWDQRMASASRPVQDPQDEDIWADMPIPAQPAPSRPSAALLADPHDGDPFHNWLPDPPLDELEFAA